MQISVLDRGGPEIRIFVSLMYDDLITVMAFKSMIVG
jgi:hypothetical protein